MAAATTAPELCAGNPGQGTGFRIGVARGDGSWEERHNLVELLAQGLSAAGHEVRAEQGFLWHPASGFTIVPQLVGVQPTEDSFRTLTTVQVNHPRLLPEGAFEYQHGVGSSVRESFVDGFDGWIRGDFVPLCDALRAETTDCQAMLLEVPEEPGKPACKRRAVLGPVWRVQAKQQPSEAKPDEADGHDFCPCCLLTRSFQAFSEFLRGDATYCLRLYAARHPDGPGADCRVNGQDHEPGMQALIRYVETWPGVGIDFRKQYVVIHTLPRG